MDIIPVLAVISASASIVAIAVSFLPADRIPRKTRLRIAYSLIAIGLIFPCQFVCGQKQIIFWFRSGDPAIQVSSAWGKINLTMKFPLLVANCADKTMPVEIQRDNRAYRKLANSLHGTWNIEKEEILCEGKPAFAVKGQAFEVPGKSPAVFSYVLHFSIMNRNRNELRESVESLGETVGVVLTAAVGQKPVKKISKTYPFRESILSEFRKAKILD